MDHFYQPSVSYRKQ